MAEYKVELIMSEEYIINAESKEEAEQNAREQFGCNYYIDEVKVTEVKKHIEDCLISENEKHLWHFIKLKSRKLISGQLRLRQMIQSRLISLLIR